MLCAASSCSTPASLGSQAACQDAQKELQAWQSVGAAAVPETQQQQQQQPEAAPLQHQQAAAGAADQQSSLQLPANGAHQPHQPHQQQQDPQAHQCVLEETAWEQPSDADADADAGLEYQKNICRSLRAENCSSVEQLAVILSEHGPHMDGQAVAASCTAAAWLGKQLQHRQQQEQLLLQQQQGASSNRQRAQYQLLQLLEQQLLPLLRAKLRQLDALGLQMVLYSLASLQYRQEVLVLELVSKSSTTACAA